MRVYKRRSGMAVISLVLMGAQIAFAADNFTDIVIYRGGGDTSIPEYRLRQNGSFGAEGTAQDITSAIEFVRVAARPDPVSDEKVLCTGDGAGDINCQIWNGSSWGDLLEVSANAGANRAFDLAYESLSANAMVCFRSPSPNTSTPVCQIWDGSSWGSAFSANAVGGAINTLRLIADPRSDRMALMTKDASNDVNIQIWDGSSFGSVTELETDGGGCARCTSYDGAWESAQGDFVAAWFNDAADALYSREYDTSAGWGSTITDIVTGLSTADTNFVRVVANPNPSSNAALVAVADDDNTLTANSWDGSDWGTAEELSASIGLVAATNHLFDIAYEHKLDNDAVITYGVTAAALRYRVWDTTTLTWGAESTLPTAVEDKDWHILSPHSDSQAIMLTTVGDTNDVDTLEWDGSAWDVSWTSHETDGNDQFRTAGFVYDYEDEDALTPVGTFTSAVQGTDGTGTVDITIEVDDGDEEDTKAKVEYETDSDGACDGPWAAATLTGTTTADFDDSGGAPDIDNGADYQVGSGATTRIITSSGPNTVQFDWDSATDLPAADGTQCLRLTVNDDQNDQTTPDTFTLTVDNANPTGLADFVSMGAGASTQHLNWTSASDNHFGHYEVWYGEVEADVANRTGTATEFDESDFSALATAATFHTHIINLTASTTYYYKLWAVDAYGNEQTVAGISDTTDAAGNGLAVVTAASGMTQSTTGSGFVTFTANIRDVDLDETMLRVRFSDNGGTTFYNAQIISVATDPVQVPVVSIDVNDFQVGKTDHIDTTSPAGDHSVDLTLVWDTKSTSNQNGGLDGQDNDDIILQLTPRDSPSNDIGLDVDSSAFTVDNKGPFLEETTAIGVTTDTTPTFTFTADEDGTLAYAGSCSGVLAVVASGTNTLDFDTLAEGDYTDCSLIATDTYGNTGALVIADFAVDTTDPTVPSSFNATDAGTSTVTVVWDTPTEAHFARYRVWYGTNSADVASMSGTAQQWDDDHPLHLIDTIGTTITGLSAGTTYYFMLTINDEAGNDSATSVIAQLTESTSSSSSSSAGSVGGNGGGGSRQIAHVVQSLHTRSTQPAAPASADTSTQTHQASVAASGQSPPFHDVANQWFAPYVRSLAALSIITGYHDAAGQPTGFFHPGDPVTYAEIAKIAQLSAGLTPPETGLDSRWQGHWAQPYLTLASQRGFSLMADSFNPDHPIPRAEAVQLVLEAFGLPVDPLLQGPLPYQDLDPRHPHAAALVTATRLGIISGDLDAHGSPTGTVRPDDPLSRAEIAKIIWFSQSL
ncbi:hypothetical protein COU80_01800 [Candidatus Peregrinibacteria bacterium CG10_big_fil_rev_8_21_14_0_10_55_24]|nr:MAG: hypothetical protein COU80_01800 [Candidatus Peregrinibacteria bacterium CG10_big_fil_rev_8_21_14_0_10_55_24]